MGAEAEAGHFGYAAIECEKETKTVCKKKPTTEEVSKDFELCRPKPNEFVKTRKSRFPELSAKIQRRRLRMLKPTRQRNLSIAFTEIQINIEKYKKKKKKKKKK